MKTFLELAQDTAKESGTIQSGLPSSVSNQTGRLGKIVGHVIQSWVDIQNRRNNWLFMRASFTGQTSSGQQEYTGLAFSLARFREFIVEPGLLTIYSQALGVSDENALLPLPWHLFRSMFLRGEQLQDRPLYYSIGPSGSLFLGPIPNGTYVVRGDYRKSTQRLAENNDIPDMPGDYHDIITWGALLYLAEHDEAMMNMATARRRYDQAMGDLERDQLPRMALAGPLV
jgi:hypothetical protein